MAVHTGCSHSTGLTGALARPASGQIELLLLSFRRVIMWREMYRLCAKCAMKPFLNCLVRVRAYPAVQSLGSNATLAFGSICRRSWCCRRWTPSRA